MADSTKEDAGVCQALPIEIESVSFTNTLFYQVNNEWNLNMAFSVRQLKIDLVGDFIQPFNRSELAEFKYNAVTETLTLGTGGSGGRR